ncbi:MAG: hypothetical protein N2171_04015 [Clostridia bacterium]|nr:hypothetical protein [Clostridia bacterium]
MKYQLTVEDWLKLKYYLLKSKRSEKNKLLFFKICSMVILGIDSLAVSGETANVWLFPLYLIFIIPLWILSGQIYKQFIKMQLKRTLIKNPIYLSEWIMAIWGKCLRFETRGIVQFISLDEIRDVILDDDLIYLACPDGFRIVPNRVFESERKKADFLDTLTNK